LPDVSLEKCSGLKDNSRDLKLYAGIHAIWQDVVVAARVMEQLFLPNSGRGRMAKSQEIKKDEKKKSQKTLKEKRLEKKAKKESKK